MYTVKLHHEEDWLNPINKSIRPTNEFWEILDDNNEQLILGGIEFYPTQDTAQESLDSYLAEQERIENELADVEVE